MIESGLYNYWRKLDLKKSLNKKQFNSINQNEDDFRAVDVKLISVGLILSTKQ